MTYYEANYYTIYKISYHITDIDGIGSNYENINITYNVCCRTAEGATAKAYCQLKKDFPILEKMCFAYTMEIETILKGVI